MPELNLDQELISLSAGARFGDMAEVQADGLVEFRGQAALRRGIELELGVGALAQIDAGFSKFIAVDAEARAFAEAQLRGQIQLPIDLFEEAGVVVRLRAIARAAVQGRIAIGLAVGDFLALAKDDPRIGGIYFELLKVFLNEIEPKIGVRGIASVAAKAYLNLSVTGQLVENETDGIEPGFTIDFGMGAGLNAGFGVGVFAEMGIRNSRRLIRRSVDALVDEGIAQILDRIPGDDPQAASLVRSLRGPAKIAFRMAFEVGLATAEKSSLLTNSGTELANRVVTVFLEELQRVLLEELTKAAIAAIQQALSALGAADDAWAQSEDQRNDLGTLLKDMPEDPFDVTPVNLTYWGTVINHCVSIAIALGGDNLVGADWARPVSLLWSSVQLMFAAAERVVDAQARATFFGALSAEARIEAFKGQIVHSVTAPAVIRDTVNQSIGRPDAAIIEQQHLVEYLVQNGIDELLVHAPELRPVLEIVAGPGADAAALAVGFSTVLDNAGAFVPGPDGSVDPEATLRALGEGFNDYFEYRIENELQPVLHDVVNDDPTLGLYIDEVLLPSMLFASETIIDRVLDWSFGDVGYKDSLREACSSMLMKVFGRSLVVTSDVLVNHALTHLRAEILELHTQAADDGGIAHTLSDSTGIERDITTELVEEGLLIAADVFGPMPEDKRARIRSRLYTVLDPMPAGADSGWVSDLAEDLFIPDAPTRDALYDLALELGTTLKDLVVRFFGRFIARVGEIVITELWDLVEAGQAAAQAWLFELQASLGELTARLLALPGEILAAAQAATRALDDALADIRAALAVFDADSDTLAAGVRQSVASAASTALSGNLIYQALPKAAKDIARNALSATVDTVASNDVLSPVLDLVQVGSGIADDILEDVQLELRELQTIDPEASVSATLNRIFFDRIEAAATDAFGGTNPKLPIAFSFSYDSFLGTVDTTIDLGSVEIPLVELVAAFRAAAESIGAVSDALVAASTHLLASLAALDDESALELEQSAAQQLKPLLEEQASEANVANAGIVVVEPAHSAQYDGDVPVELVLQNVPASFVGLGDLEAERIFVYVNEQGVDLSEFSIDEQLGPVSPLIAIGATVSGKNELIQLTVGSKIGQANARDNNTVPGWLTAATTATPIQTKARRDGTKTRKIHRPGDKHQALTSRVDTTVADMTATRKTSVRASTRHRRAQPGLIHRRGETVASTASAADLTTTTIYTKTLPSDRDEILQAAGPGIVLRGSLPRSQLRTGVNTLTCAVTSGHGEPVATTVVFLVEPAAQSPLIAIDAIGTVATFGFDNASTALTSAIGLNALRADAAPRLKVDDPARSTDREIMPGLPARKIREARIAASARCQARRIARPTKRMKALCDDVANGGLRPVVHRQKRCTDKSRSTTPTKKTTCNPELQKETSL